MVGWFSPTIRTMWSLWNRLTSIIHLPPLILEDGDCDEPIKDCCLSSPPDDPESVLLLTCRTNKSTFVFCQLDRKKWTEMSYAELLKQFTRDGNLVHSLACCNGKIYALNTDSTIVDIVIEVDIVVKDREALIRLLLCIMPCVRQYIG